MHRKQKLHRKEPRAVLQTLHHSFLLRDESAHSQEPALRRRAALCFAIPRPAQRSPCQTPPASPAALPVFLPPASTNTSAPVRPLAGQDAKPAPAARLFQWPTSALAASPESGCRRLPRLLSAAR